MVKQYKKNTLRRRSSGVERFLGKEKVTSSILVVGSKYKGIEMIKTLTLIYN